MSTVVDHIVIVGYSVPEEKLLDLDYAEYEVLEDEHDIDVVIDGMCGEYVVVGEILSEYNVYEDYSDADDLLSFTPREIQERIEDVYDLLKDHIELSIDDIQLHFIHHWH